MRAALGASVAVAAVVCAGCLARGDFRPTHYYTLAPEPEAATPAEAAPLRVTVSVRRFTANARYGQRIVRRLSAVELDYDEYHRWSESPEELVGEALCRALRARRVFASVVGPDLEVVSDVTVEGHVLAFEQTVDQQAECAVAFVVRRQSDGKALWAGSFTARDPMGGPSRADLAQAMSLSVSQIADQCAQAWRALKALQPAPSP